MQDLIQKKVMDKQEEVVNGDAHVNELIPVGTPCKNSGCSQVSYIILFELEWPISRFLSLDLIQVWCLKTKYTLL